MPQTNDGSGRILTDPVVGGASEKAVQKEIEEIVMKVIEDLEVKKIEEAAQKELDEILMNVIEDIETKEAEDATERELEKIVMSVIEEIEAIRVTQFVPKVDYSKMPELVDDNELDDIDTTANEEVVLPIVSTGLSKTYAPPPQSKLHDLGCNRQSFPIMQLI